MTVSIFLNLRVSNLFHQVNEPVLVYPEHSRGAGEGAVGLESFEFLLEGAQKFGVEALGADALALFDYPELWVAVEEGVEVGDVFRALEGVRAFGGRLELHLDEDFGGGNHYPKALDAYGCLFAFEDLLEQGFGHGVLPFRGRGEVEVDVGEVVDGVLFAFFGVEFLLGFAVEDFHPAEGRVAVEPHFLQLGVDGSGLYFFGVEEDVDVPGAEVDHVQAFEEVVDGLAAHEADARAFFFGEALEERVEEFVGLFNHEFFHGLTSGCPAILRGASFPVPRRGLLG